MSLESWIDPQAVDWLRRLGPKAPAERPAEEPEADSFLDPAAQEQEAPLPLAPAKPPESVPAEPAAYGPDFDRLRHRLAELKARAEARGLIRVAPATPPELVTGNAIGGATAPVIDAQHPPEPEPSAERAAETGTKPKPESESSRESLSVSEPEPEPKTEPEQPSEQVLEVESAPDEEREPITTNEVADQAEPTEIPDSAPDVDADVAGTGSLEDPENPESEIAVAPVPIVPRTQDSIPPMEVAGGSLRERLVAYQAWACGAFDWSAVAVLDRRGGAFEPGDFPKQALARAAEFAAGWEAAHRGMNVENHPEPVCERLDGGLLVVAPVPTRFGPLFTAALATAAPADWESRLAADNLRKAAGV